MHLVLTEYDATEITTQFVKIMTNFFAVCAVHIHQHDMSMHCKINFVIIYCLLHEFYPMHAYICQSIMCYYNIIVPRQ